MGKWLFLLFFIGVALIGLGFTNFIAEDAKLSVIVAGAVLIILVILWLWWASKRKRKTGFAAPKGGGRFRMPQYPAVTPESKKAYERKIAREQKKIEAAEVMKMRAVNPKDLRRRTV